MIQNIWWPQKLSSKFSSLSKIKTIFLFQMKFCQVYTETDFQEMLLIFIGLEGGAGEVLKGKF